MVLVPIVVPVDERREMDEDAREVERSHQKGWSTKRGAEGCRSR